MLLPDPSSLGREVFLVVLGQRLRAARERAGLTQGALARSLSGKSGTKQQVVSRLEQGLGGAPSILLVLDYLRACGAGLEVLEDLAAAWTGGASPTGLAIARAVAAVDADLPVGALDAATRYAQGVIRQDGGELPRGRALRRVAHRAARRGAAETEARALDAMLEQELAAAGVKPGSLHALPLKTFGRMVLAALKRTRKSRYWRGRALAKLERWPRENGLPEGPAARVRSAVERWFAATERRLPAT
jgi:transcriptional regulator with XRE-family HTH domain